MIKDKGNYLIQITEDTLNPVVHNVTGFRCSYFSDFVNAM